MSEKFELVSRGNFGKLLLRLQDEQYSERRVETVNIEDNKHCHKVMLDFSLSFFPNHLGLFFEQQKIKDR